MRLINELITSNGFFLLLSLCFFESESLSLPLSISLSPYLLIGCFLPYYLPTYLSEFVLVLLIGLLQFFCILLSYINLQRFSILLTIPILISIVYFLVWQQYVLFIELITNSFCIAFQVFYALTAITDKFVWISIATSLQSSCQPASRGCHSLSVFYEIYCSEIWIWFLHRQWI